MISIIVDGIAKLAGIVVDAIAAKDEADHAAVEAKFQAIMSELADKAAAWKSDREKRDAATWAALGGDK